MWFADNRHVDSWKGDGTCFGMHFGTILAPIFASLGDPGDPKWASRGPGRESRGCFGGMLILGVFLDDFRDIPES